MTHPPALPRRRLRALAVLLLVAGAAGPLAAQETPYEVELTGVEDPELRDLLTAASSLFDLREQPPPSPVGLRRRAEADRERLTTALRSAGYYAAALDIGLDTGIVPARVTVAVDPGPRYRIASVAVEPVEGATLPAPPPGRDVLGLAPGDPAAARAVVAAEARLIAFYAERGFVRAAVPERRVVVDHADQTMAATYFLAPGPLVRLGDLRVRGLETVEEPVVRRRADWRPGRVYDPDLVEELRGDIAELAIFDAVRVTLADGAGPDGLVPVDVVVSERLPRFFGAGVRYSTTEGFGGDVFWGHRNLFGGAEVLRVEAAVARVGANAVEETDLNLRATLTKPDFLAREQRLILEAAIVSENPDAFERDALVLAAALERPIAEGVVFGYGVTAEQSRIREDGRRTDNTLFGVPLSLAVDRSDDILNPTEGWRLDLATTPYAQRGDAGGYFVVNRATATAYRGLDDAGRFVLAARASVGAIAGSELRDIPADKRFYAGGGGSIRGYGFQEVGPVDAEGDRIGGRSLFEVSGEVRVRITETIGLVPFVDGGNAYRTALPNFDRELRWAAGLGVRYFTGFGPLRADVAVPIDRRGGEDAFQFYISLGQAF